MYIAEPTDCAFPDVDLLTRHAQVEEDGILTGPKASPGVHALQAWLTMDLAQRKPLQEALKLEERYWRRHRTLAAELRLVQRFYPN